MDNVKVARQLVRLAKELIGKTNQKDYKFYVVVDGEYIESGWEYKEDAKDALDGDYGSGKGTKVLQKAGLKNLGLDPNKDADWKK